jgi:hypothetical protein
MPETQIEMKKPAFEQHYTDEKGGLSCQEETEQALWARDLSEVVGPELEEAVLAGAAWAAIWRRAREGIACAQIVVKKPHINWAPLVLWQHAQNVVQKWLEDNNDSATKLQKLSFLP